VWSPVDLETDHPFGSLKEMKFQRKQPPDVSQSLKVCLEKKEVFGRDLDLPLSLKALLS